VETLDGARRRERFGNVALPAVSARALLAWCHAELGRFAESRALAEEGCQIAETVAHPASLMWAYYGIGLPSLRQGDLPRALSQLERALGSCQETERPAMFPAVAVALGAAYTLCGRVADAVLLLTQVLEQTTVGETVAYRARCNLSLGEAHALAERALALARMHQERGNQAYALRLLGEIAARREPPEGMRLRRDS
jgi:tetratricopeptide (TPR) repeat protein